MSKCKHCEWGTCIGIDRYLCLFPSCIKDKFRQKEGEETMPIKPRRGCSMPGCAALTYDSYCKKHKAQLNREYDKRRGTASKRGYDSRWQKVRKRYLAKHPLCAECFKEDKSVVATVVHHRMEIKNGGEIFDESNLMAVCNECHEKIHRKDRFKKRNVDKSVNKSVDKM